MENQKSILIVGKKAVIDLIPAKTTLAYFGMKKFIANAKPLEIVPDFDAVITSDVYPTEDDLKTFEVVDAVEFLIELERKGLIIMKRVINERT